MRIAIYGCYKHGNFGDDLMAAMVHRDLVQAGFDVTVYGMCEADAAELGMKTEQNPEALVDNCDAFVLGGGGLYIKHTHPWPPIVADYQELGRLLDRCATQGKGVYGVSLGGSGATEFPDWQQSVVQFTRQAKFYSVRNQQDLAISRAAGRDDVPCYPDIVWSTSACFPKEKPRAELPLILVNLYLTSTRIERHAMTFALRRLGRARRARVLFVDSHATRKFGARRPAQLGPNAGTYKFSQITADLGLLASADLVLTTRLHTGLACLSYGVPMVSFGGEAKARLMLESVGLGSNYFGGWRTWLLGWRLGSPERVARSVARPDEARRTALTQGAQQHTRDLIKHLRLASPARTGGSRP